MTFRPPKFLKLRWSLSMRRYGLDILAPSWVAAGHLLRDPYNMVILLAAHICPITVAMGTAEAETDFV